MYWIKSMKATVPRKSLNVCLVARDQPKGSTINWNRGRSITRENLAENHCRHMWFERKNYLIAVDDCSCYIKMEMYEISHTDRRTDFIDSKVENCKTHSNKKNATGNNRMTEDLQHLAAHIEGSHFSQEIESAHPLLVRSLSIRLDQSVVDHCFQVSVIFHILYLPKSITISLVFLTFNLRWFCLHHSTKLSTKSPVLTLLSTLTYTPINTHQLQSLTPVAETEQRKWSSQCFLYHQDTNGLMAAGRWQHYQYLNGVERQIVNGSATSSPVASHEMWGWLVCGLLAQMASTFWGLEPSRASSIPSTSIEEFHVKPSNH